MRMGYVLLLASAVPGFMAWVLALKGLNKVSTATDKVDEVVKQTTKRVAETQPAVAAMTGTDALTLAQTNAEIAVQTSQLTDVVSDARDALKEMTGVFAPARAFLAIAFVLLVAALVALDVISASAGGT